MPDTIVRHPTRLAAFLVGRMPDRVTRHSCADRDAGASRPTPKRTAGSVASGKSRDRYRVPPYASDRSSIFRGVAMPRMDHERSWRQQKRPDPGPPQSPSGQKPSSKMREKG